MKIIISPAKKMNIDDDIFECRSEPVFLNKAEELMNYLKDLGLTDDDITIINGSSEASVIEKLKLFPSLVKENYTYLKGIGIKNYKEVFMGHTHMFFINPDRFRAIFEKYDHADLIRCLEKNAAVIEKL